MESSTGSTKQPQTSMSDQTREKAQAKNYRWDITLGVLFILQGILTILANIVKSDVANVPNIVLMPVGILLLIAVLMQGRTFLKYKLSPQDEYEAQADAFAKAKAFNYLTAGLFFIMLLVPEAFAMSAVSILFGVVWLMAARGARDDAKAAA